MADKHNEEEEGFLFGGEDDGFLIELEPPIEFVYLDDPKRTEELYSLLWTMRQEKEGKSGLRVSNRGVERRPGGPGQ